MHLIKLFTLVVFLNPFFSKGQKEESFNTLDQYLATAAVKIEKEAIIDNLGYFINNDFNKKKNRLKWFRGSITTKKGEVFKDLQLKFNTINNSLYIKRNDKILKVSQFRISEFSLIDNGKVRKFNKGFSVPTTSGFSVEFEMNAPEFLRFLMGYENFDQLEIASLTLGSQDQVGRIDIELNTNVSDNASDFKKYLFSRSGIKSVKVDSGSSDTSVNTFFEVLLDYENFRLLKWNSKRLSSIDVVSLAENSNVHVFKEETYYFSNSKNEIQKFVFAKKSIKNGLQFVGITDTKTIPSFPNEKKLMHWLELNIE